MIKFIFTFILALCVIVPSQYSSAHVLITDDSNSKGAILHIIPDDDPVAGEEATLYFDTQKQLLGENDSVTLTIRDDSGIIYNVPTDVNESLATADFTFPDLGIYEIKFVLINDGESFTFTQTQRVSRGISNGSTNTQKYAWAEMLLVGSGIALALLIVVGFNNRKDIIKYSKIG